MSKFDIYFELCKKQKPKKIAVAAAEGEEVLTAVDAAIRMGIADAVLIGDAQQIRNIIAEKELSLDCEIIDEKDYAAASALAVKLVRGGNAQVLMKGVLQSSYLMKAMLNRETGIRDGDVLNSIQIIDSPKMDRLIYLSDGGMIPYPTFEQKIGIIKNTAKVAHKLGVDYPKVACVCAVETVNPLMPATMDAAALSLMSQRGQFKDCVVDGPLGLDNAISTLAAEEKKVTSPVNVVGHADILIVPNIETGNAVMKALRYMSDCSTVGLMAGTTVPVVMSSRAERTENKLRSIACALLMS